MAPLDGKDPRLDRRASNAAVLTSGPYDSEMRSGLFVAFYLSSADVSL